MTTRESIELASVDADKTPGSSSLELTASSLPPMDRGREAYRFLAGACVLEALTWGYSLSWGVMQDYFTSGPFKDSSPVAIATIGTVAVALQYSLLLPLSFVYRRFPRHIRTITWVNLAVTGLALFISSFASQIWQLILTQGIIYGASSSAMYAPVIVYLSEWFAERKGMASGVIFAFTGISGFALPLILGHMLRAVDWRWTVRIYAIVSTVFCAAALTQVRPRLPLPPKGRIAPMPIAWLRSPLFWPVLCTVFFQAIPSLTVSLYIPTYSTALGQTFFVGQLSLAFFNLAGVVGRVGIGVLCDRYSWVALMFASAFLSCIVAFTLWGLASTLGLLLAFSIIFGGSSAGFTSAWVPAASTIGRNDRQQQTVLFGVFSLAKGLAAVIGPLIGGSLRQDEGSPSAYGLFGFEPIILFVGGTMALTCFGTIASGIVRRRMQL